MDQLIGFVLGILGSIATWWIFAHWLVPSVRFEEKILVRPSKAGAGERRYLLKFANVGRRDLIDVTVMAYVSIQTKPGSERSWSSSRLAFHRTGEISHAMAIVPRGRNRLLTIHAAHSDQILHDMNYSEGVRQSVADRSLDLMRLMSDGAASKCEVRLRAHLFGYDSFSGARKLFSSKSYGIEDFQIPDELRAPAPPGPA